METLQRHLKHKSIDVGSALAIVRDAVALTRSAPDPHAAAVDILQRLAAGADGVRGTADDLIPPSTVDKLVAMMETDLVHELVDFLSTSKLTGWCCIDKFRLR